jgi:hypothetical protein
MEQSINSHSMMAFATFVVQNRSLHFSDIFLNDFHFLVKPFIKYPLQPTVTSHVADEMQLRNPPHNQPSSVVLTVSLKALNSSVRSWLAFELPPECSSCSRETGLDQPIQANIISGVENDEQCGFHVDQNG